MTSMEKIAASLTSCISDTLEKCGLMFRIFSRVKSESSIRHKLEVKYASKRIKIQDMIGIRIVVYFQDDVDALALYYSIGDVVDAKIVKLMTFGAFAEILPGVDGLIHISQIADKRIGKPEDVLAEGQEVQVKITDVDAENKRISLSIRALLAPAAEETEEVAEEAAE